MKIAFIDIRNRVIGTQEWDGHTPLDLADNVAIRDVTGLDVPEGSLYDPMREVIYTLDAKKEEVPAPEADAPRVL